jgi:hypothetical protein
MLVTVYPCISHICKKDHEGTNAVWAYVVMKQLMCDDGTKQVSLPPQIWNQSKSKVEQVEVPVPTDSGTWVAIYMFATLICYSKRTNVDGHVPLEAAE